MIQEEKLVSMFDRAVQGFLRNESENISNDVSERNLCGRLAIALENALPEYGLESYYADTEYNRKQNGEIKTILNDQMCVIRISCDLIVHSRGEEIEQDNLIAVEMKKAQRPESDKDSDRMRLRALTKDPDDGMWSNDGRTSPQHVCGYMLGVYMEIDDTERTCRFEYYKRGEKQSESLVRF